MSDILDTTRFRFHATTVLQYFVRFIISPPVVRSCWLHIKHPPGNETGWNYWGLTPHTADWLTRLLFGIYRYFNWGKGKVECIWDHMQVSNHTANHDPKSHRKPQCDRHQCVWKCDPKLCPPVTNKGQHYCESRATCGGCHVTCDSLFLRITWQSGWVEFRVGIVLFKREVSQMSNIPWDFRTWLEGR
jgi:hypothetical protein